MGRLQEILLDKSRRGQVIDDCVGLIDSEVAAKGGLGGLAVKGGYAVVKKIKPGFIRHAVDHLLDEFVAQLEPFHEDFVKGGGTNLASYLSSKATQVAEALLKITDTRISRNDNRTITTVYGKLRPHGVKHVETAVPGIAQVLQKYV